jgi:RNA polymerase sigma factor (sigma-70 family)
MTNGPTTRALEDLGQLVKARRRDDPTDRQLLERFIDQKDDAGFAQLVRRHGPMVMGVCRRVLRNWHDAEDAFQATFLVLARKAAAVRRRDAACGWLYQVAYHVALKLRTSSNRKRTCTLPEVAAPDQENGPAEQELRLLLDEELCRLPDKYRLPLLLCHGEGKTRAEAARLLGWKEGAVKIRLERGRDLLRKRLTRRGVGLSALVLGSLLARNAAASGPPFLLPTGFGSAALASGPPPAAVVAPSAVALARGVLKTMMMTRLKLVALLVAVTNIALFAAGLGACWALAQARQETAPLAPEPDRGSPARPAPKKAAVPPADGKAPGPLRVLLFADGPTREYQFLRALFLRHVELKQVELSSHLQTGAPDDLAEGLPVRRLKQFPGRLVDTRESKEGAEDRQDNLASYQVIIAIDPDWSRLTAVQRQLLPRWLSKKGRALILIAGPVNTFRLVRPGAAGQLKPILDLYPVLLEDGRVAEERATDQPRPLRFHRAAEFLKLDDKAKAPLAGWSQFFFGKQRDDWQQTGDPPVRGFYSVYPVTRVKPAAQVLATFRAARTPGAPNNVMPRDVPYLVAMPVGKGTALYLGSGESWRLRQFSTAFYERFWSELIRHATRADLAPLHRPGARVWPERRKAVEQGLRWLVREQHRDGHWEGAQEERPVTLTALAGMALLMHGNTIREGEYANNLRRAVDWLVQRGQADGRIGNLAGRPEADLYMDGHSRALLFLASAFGEEEDVERRVRLRRLLTRAVQYTVKAQAAAGGWGHVVRGLAREDDNQADIRATVLQVQALRAARSSGITVPQRSLDTARAYLLAKIGPASPSAILALAFALAPEEFGSPAARQWLRKARDAAPVLDPTGRRPAGDELHVFAYALVAHVLGEVSHAERLKTDEQLAWHRERQKVLDHLLKTQGADGSWDGASGKAYATALYLAILELDGEVVPVYRR